MYIGTLALRVARMSASGHRSGVHALADDRHASMSVNTVLPPPGGQCAATSGLLTLSCAASLLPTARSLASRRATNPAATAFIAARRVPAAIDSAASSTVSPLRRLLGTARKEQLLDTAFHATWGFLFDGYRAPTRKLVPTGGSVGEKSATLPPAVVDSGGTGSTPTAAALASPGADANTLLATGRSFRSRRRSSLLPERLAQTWVVEGDSRVWWEALVLGRKAGVVLLAVLVTNPYMQCVGATLWFFGAILLQLKYAPYEQAKFNRLELATLTATFVTAVVSTALLQFNVDVATADLHPPAAMTPIEWAVTIALVVINLGTFAALCFLWLRVQWDRARTLWRALPLRRATVPVPPPAPTAGLPTSRDDGRDRKKGGGGMALTTLNPLHSGGGASPADTPCMKAVPMAVAGGAGAPAAMTVARAPPVRVRLAVQLPTSAAPQTSAARAALGPSAT